MEICICVVTTCIRVVELVFVLWNLHLCCDDLYLCCGICICVVKTSNRVVEFVFVLSLLGHRRSVIKH